MFCNALFAYDVVGQPIYVGIYNTWQEFLIDILPDVYGNEINGDILQDQTSNHANRLRLTARLELPLYLSPGTGYVVAILHGRQQYLVAYYTYTHFDVNYTTGDSVGFVYELNIKNY